MFTSKVALPQDFFDKESNINEQENTPPENGFKHPLNERAESNSFMTWIPFGRASQVVRRGLNEADNADAESSLNEPTNLDLSPVGFYDDNLTFSESFKSKSDGNDSTEVSNASVFEEEAFRGGQSFKELLPHPSQLRMKKSAKRKKPLGFEVDHHLRQILLKSKELKGMYSEKGENNDLFPSPIHNYETTSAKRVKMDINFMDREI